MPKTDNNNQIWILTFVKKEKYIHYFVALLISK